MAYSEPRCPSFHPLVPLASLRVACDLCLNARSYSAFGCVACDYGVCKWCYMGGGRLMEIVATAQRAVTDLRLEMEGLKRRVDGDVYVWV